VLVLGSSRSPGRARSGAAARRRRAPRSVAQRGARAGQIALFLPALIIPATALAGTLLFKHVSVGGAPLVDPKQITLVSLGLGVVVALAVAMAWLRPPPLVPLQEGRKLMDAVGWAAVLPQMLAALGSVFALAASVTSSGFRERPGCRRATSRSQSRPTRSAWRSSRW
jgi:uncharacterized membrane protein